jgi:hypothetical protein
MSTADTRKVATGKKEHHRSSTLFHPRTSGALVSEQCSGSQPHQISEHEPQKISMIQA